MQLKQAVCSSLHPFFFFFTNPAPPHTHNLISNYLWNDYLHLFASKYYAMSSLGKNIKSCFPFLYPRLAFDSL